MENSEIKGTIIGIGGGIFTGKDEVTEMIQYITSNYNNDSFSFEDYIHNKTSNSICDIYENIKFAKKIKQMIAVLLDVDESMLEDREFKLRPIPELELVEVKFSEDIVLNGLKTSKIRTSKDNVDSTIDELLTQYYIEHGSNDIDVLSKTKIEVTPRWLMINIGTIAIRNHVSNDFWVSSTMLPFKSDSKWIISDVRFTNEIKAISNKNGINILIKRPFGNRYNQYKHIEDKTDVYKIPKTLLDLDEKLYNEITSEPERLFQTNNEHYFDIIIENDGTLEELFQKILELILKLKLVW